jgi:tetratricopeptide (TPR) repeat protein
MRRDALVVGINQYPFLKDTPTSPAKHLTTPAADAEAIAQLLETDNTFTVTRLPQLDIDGKVRVDPKGQVSLEELSREINKLFCADNNRDTALLFFAGHGLQQLNSLGNKRKICLATSKSNTKGTGENSISLNDLWELLEESPVKEQIILLDNCFSGELLEFQESDFPGRVSGRRRLIIAASHSAEVAYERLDGKHGVLSGALIEGLDRSKIPQGDWITDRTLADFIEKELKKYYEQTKIPQIPQIRRSDQEIKIILGKGQQTFKEQKRDKQCLEREIPFVLPQFDVSTFTGRDDEFKQLEDLLLKSQGTKFSRIAGLVGVGGIGKSALACHFATIHKADFSDGVIGLRVDGKDVNTIARQFVSRFGEDIDPDDERDAATIMQEVFAHRRMLLIFDNADNDSIRKLLPGGSRCAVIVTTRDRGLAISLEIPNEGRINLPKLSEAEALSLLKEVIDTEKQRVEAEPEAAHQLIKMVGYLPLAIKIIGSLLSLYDRRSLAEQIEILTEEKQLVKMQFGDSEHLNLFACFSLSLKHLILDEINFFACLSVCAKNGFSLQTAMAVTNCNKSLTRKCIDDKLFRLSLINYSDIEKHHFVFHPLIYEFAAFKAVELGAYEEAAARHADYFIQFVKREINHEVAQEIATELDDIILAAQWLQQKTSKHQEEDKYEFAVCLQPFFEQYGYWEKAVQLMRGFEKLAESNKNWEKVIKFRIQQAKYLSLLGQLKSAEKLIQNNTISPILKEIDEKSIRQSYKAKWLNTLGSHIFMRQKEFHKAVKVFKSSVEIEKQLNNNEGLVIALNSLGKAMRQFGNLKEAETIIKDSYIICEQLNDKRQIAFILHNLGQVFLEQSRWDEAFDSIQSSYVIFKELEHQRSVLMTLSSLSRVLEKQGKIDEAIIMIQESVTIEENLNDKPSILIKLNRLASLYQQLGQFDKAMEFVERGIAIAQETDNTKQSAIILTQLSRFYQQNRQFKEAIESCERAIIIAQESGNKQQLAINLNQLGGLYQQQKCFDEAIQSCKSALDIAKEIDDNKQQLTIVLTQLCVIYQQQEKINEAIESYEDRIKIYKENKEKKELPITLNKLSSLYQQQGRNDEAIISLKDSLEIAKEIGDQQQLLFSSNQLGSLYIEQRQFSKAIEYFENAVEIAKEMDDKHSLTITLKLVAGLHQKQGQIEKAIQSLEHIVTIAEEANNRQLLEKILENSIDYILFLCKAYASYVCLNREVAKIRDIEMILRSCYNLCLKVDDTKSLGSILYRLGKVMYLKGGEDNLKFSCMYFRESIKYSNDKYLSKVHTAMGESLLALERFQEATEEFCTAFEIDEISANIDGLKKVTPFLIYSLVHLGRCEEAINLCERSLIISSDEPVFLELDDKVNSSKQIPNPNALKQGIIKFIKKDERGRIYGFILAEDVGNDIYFQESSIAPKEISKLRKGSHVEMEVKRNEKGMFAERLWIVTNRIS